MNKCFVTGRIAKDAALRTVNTTNGETKVANFALFVKRSTKKDAIADVFNVTLWNKAAENVAPYLKKGTLVAVNGMVFCGKPYTANDGTVKCNVELTADSVELLARPANSEPVSTLGPDTFNMADYDLPKNSTDSNYSEVGNEDVIPF